MTERAPTSATAHETPRDAPSAMNDTFTIALFSVSGLATVTSPGADGFSIVEFARALNNLNQTTFDFTAGDVQWHLGDYDQVHLYSDERYWTKLREEKQHGSWNAVIAITPEELEQAVFNKHKEDEGIGIVTVNGFAEYLPPGGSLYRYLAFLVLCETLCLVKGVQFEHKQSRRCLFDMCHDKSDLKNCLKYPSVERDCLGRLRNEGFSKTQLDDVFKILTYVGTPSFPALMMRSVTEPGSGFLAGIFATLGISVLITVSVSAAEITLAGVAAGFLAMLGVQTIRGRPRPPRKAHWWRRVQLRFSRR